ncbi:ubiquinol-cytochrome-c reductase complex assembly factor 1 [Lates japonicus]
MYRRPLQSAVRNVINVTASRAAYRKALDQEACFARALVAFQLARVSSPCVTPCRTLHITTQLCNVKETPQHSEEEVGAFTKLIEAMGFTGPLKYNKWKIKIAALRMYTCCVERINYDEFFDSKCERANQSPSSQH